MSGINPQRRAKQTALLHRIRSAINVVLQYSCKIDDLSVWKWCVSVISSPAFSDFPVQARYGPRRTGDAVRPL